MINGSLGASLGFAIEAIKNTVQAEQQVAATLVESSRQSTELQSAGIGRASIPNASHSEVANAPRGTFVNLIA